MIMSCPKKSKSEIANHEDMTRMTPFGIVCPEELDKAITDADKNAVKRAIETHKSTIDLTIFNMNVVKNLKSFTKPLNKVENVLTKCQGIATCAGGRSAKSKRK